MASPLDHLKVSHAVPHNAEVSEKLNALIALIESMQGRNGIRVTLSGRNILIGFGGSARAVAGAQGAAGSQGGDGGGGGASDELHYDDGTTSIDIDGSGVVLTDLATGRSVKMIPGGELEVFNFTSAATLLIDPALITHDMGIVTDSVCVVVGGVPTLKSRLIIASTPF